MSLWLNLGQLATRAGKLLPTIDHLISWLQIPTADGKTLANSKGVDADLTDVNCLSFDGDTDHIDLPSVPSDLLEGVFDISFDLLIDDTDTGFQRIIWFIDGSKFFRMQKNNGINTFDFWATQQANTLDIFRSQNISFTPHVMFNFRAVGDGTDVKVYYDNVLQTTVPITGANKTSIFNPATPSLGVSLTSFLGKLANFKMSSGGVLHTQLPIAEGSGTTAYDISGNGNHGTITGATWSTADGFESWNHEYGFDASAVFDGTDDRIDTGLASDAAVTKASFTIKPENDGANRVIIGLANKSGTGNASTFIGTDNKLKYKARSTGSNLVNRCDTTVLTAGNTYDVVIEYGAADGTGTSVTINGVTQSFTAVNGLTHSGGDLLIGARDTGSVNSFYQGEIHSLQLETSSGVIRDFVPSDGKLLDKVNNTYYSNGGSGDIETKRYPALNTKTKQVATFDGSDDFVVTEPVTLGNNFEFEWTGSLSGAEYFGRIVANKNTPNDEGVFELFRNASENSIRFIIYPNGGSRQESAYIDFNFDGSVKTHKVTYNNGTLTYVVDDVTLYSNTFSAGNGFTGSDAFGIYSRPNGGNNCAGTLQNFKLTISGSTAFEYDFQSDIGTTTVQDLSANDNDGTATIGTADINTGAGGLAEFWGTRVADASGSLVSADYATGNTSISNPAGFVHNNSECGVKLQSRTVGTFDGEDDVVVTDPVTLGNNFEFEWTGSLSDSENFGRIFANTNSTTTEGVFELNRSGTNNSIRFVVYPNGSSRQEGFPFFFNFDGLVKTHKVTYNNGALTYVVGGVTLYSNTFSAGNGFTDSNAFGIYSRANGANSCGGTLQNFKLTISGSTAFEYDFSEGQGTTLTDLSGNSNNGTITVGASGTETFWADSYQEYEKIDLDQGFVPAQITVTDCTDTSLNGLYELDSTRNNDKLRWLKNNNTAQKVYFNSGSNRWTIQDSGGSVTKVGDTILPAEGSYGNGANLAYSTQGVFIKTSGTNITQIGQYDGDEILTATEATRNDRYFG